MIKDVNRHIEEQKVKDRFLRDTRGHLERLGKSIRNNDLRFLVRRVTAKPVYLVITKLEGTKFEEAEKAEQD
jgi:hypothetical protein